MKGPEQLIDTRMRHETPRSPEKAGFRAQLAVVEGGRVQLRSRQGTDMTAAFTDIRKAALAQLPEGTGLDGELVGSVDGIQHHLALRAENALLRGRAMSVSSGNA